MNIIQIAEMAGVSKSTVSRVLSGNGSVSPKSYEKVMRVVNEIDYQPNPYARILNKKSTSLIGIIVPDIINPYFPQIIQDIQAICTKHSYRILLCITDSGSKNEEEYLDMLENMRADGTILLCPTTQVTDISKYDRQAIISVDAVINDKIPFVCSDFYKGGYLAANKLVENGCTNILHISGHNYYYANQQRHLGFETGIKEHLNSIQSYQILSDFSMSHGLDIIHAYFQTHPNIDGIFTDNDSIAFMVLRILHSLKIEVPSKIKIIGYDDNFMIPMIYPPLSTIHQPIAQIGQLAAQTLINMINHQQINYQNILDVTYVKRSTTII